MNRPRRLLLAGLLAAPLGLAACSSGSSSSSSTTSTPTSTATSIPVSTQIDPIPATDLSPAGTAGKEPTVVVPSSAPPAHLEVADLIPGTGPKAKAGDTVQVQYVLATYSSKGVVQSSWSSQPFSFTLGQGQVIQGWDLGVAGMQAGGRRELIIPPSLGYGSQSPGPGIAANDTLVFVVDLLKIN